MNDKSKKEIGGLGEDIAVNHLKKSGYRIMARNYMTRLGEVDIIAMDGETLAFIEVKSRKEGAQVNPLYSVNRRKQRQILKAAQHYISKNNITDRMFRFDVLTVIFTEKKPEIQLIKDAFELTGVALF